MLSCLLVPRYAVNFDAMMAICRKELNHSAVKWHELWGHYSLTMRLYAPHPSAKQLDAFFNFAVLRSPTFPPDTSPLRDALKVEIADACQLAERRHVARWCLLASIAEFEPLDAFALRKNLRPNAAPDRRRLSLSVVLYEQRDPHTAHAETRLGFVRTGSALKHAERLLLETVQSFDLEKLSPHRRGMFESFNLLDAQAGTDAA